MGAILTRRATKNTSGGESNNFVETMPSPEWSELVEEIQSDFQ